MSRSKAEQPKRLAEKLRRIRRDFGWTQEQLFKALETELGGSGRLHFGYISRFEGGSRVPSLLVLLAYARVAGVAVEILIDDKLDLLEELPMKKE
jgi:transcriptional regulator with XRE-family HTH domain